jgi:hypothetical protein
MVDMDRCAIGMVQQRIGLALHPDLVFVVERGPRVNAHKTATKRGAFRSIIDLQVAILHSCPSGLDKIMAAVKRGHQFLDSVHFVQQVHLKDQLFARPSQSALPRGFSCCSSEARRFLIGR